MALPSRYVFAVPPVYRRAKDGCQKSVLCPAFAGGVVGVGRTVDAGARQPHAVAFADRAVRVVAGPRSPHGDHLAACPGYLGRLRRLLLLPGPPGTQDRIVVYPVVPAVA